MNSASPSAWRVSAPRPPSKCWSRLGRWRQRAVPIQLREEMDFRMDVGELPGLINDRTKLIILNSPQNPTGGMLTKEDVEAIARAIGDRNIMILTDEIYSRLIFEGEHHSIMSL